MSTPGIICQCTTIDLLTTDSERKHSRNAATLGIEIGQPRFPGLIRQFLHRLRHPDLPASHPHIQALTNAPFPEPISVRYSAAATYYAPSDPSGIGGMHREHIRATPSWYAGPARFDCALVRQSPELRGILGLGVVRIILFFSFKYHSKLYPCALVSWYMRSDNEPDEDTGMWIVEPEFGEDGARVVSVIHTDSIVRATHLIPDYGEEFLQVGIKEHHSLDIFEAFYVNKYADHHAFEILH